MARRGKHHEEHQNHEAWAIPYGDLITLLLAFFVVMYAISSINEGKYRVLSDSLEAAFKTPPRSLEPIQVGEISRSKLPTQPIDTEVHKEKQVLAPAREWAEVATSRLGEEALAMSAMADQVERAMAPLIEDDLIDVRRNASWLEVEINTSLLFTSGNAKPAPQALPVLKELAGMLAPMPNRVHVEGFTDNLPISTPAYPSNWELSAARAASVVRLFAEYGVDPDRMAAIGFGENRPIADNDTEAGRAKNRRVVLVVLGGEKTRDTVDKPGMLRGELEDDGAGGAG